MITTSRSEDFFWILVNKVYRLMTSVWHCFIFDFPIWLCLEIIFDFYLIWIFIMLKRNDNVYHTYCYRYAFLWCTSLLIKVYSIADCTVCTPGRTDGNEGLVSTNHNDSQRDFSVKSYFSSLSWMHASHCRRGRHIRKKRITPTVVLYPQRVNGGHMLEKWYLQSMTTAAKMTSLGWSPDGMGSLIPYTLYWMDRRAPQCLATKRDWMQFFGKELCSSSSQTGGHKISWQGTRTMYLSGSRKDPSLQMQRVNDLSRVFHPYLQSWGIIVTMILCEIAF